MANTRRRCLAVLQACPPLTAACCDQTVVTEAKVTKGKKAATGSGFPRFLTHWPSEKPNGLPSRSPGLARGTTANPGGVTVESQTPMGFRPPLGAPDAGTQPRLG